MKEAGKCTGRALRASTVNRAPQILNRRTQQLRGWTERLTANLRKPGQWARWRGDFFGGTVAALIAVPYGMALSIAIGLRPEAGLYTSIIGGAISGMISDAPVVVSGLSATVVPVLAVVVKTHGVGAALAAGALSGLMMVLIGVLRLGRFFHYLPQSVIGAFTSGLGVIIVASQLKVVFGVKPQPAGFDLGVIDDLWAVMRVIDQSDPHTVGVAGIVLVMIFLIARWKPNIPSSLIGVIVASLATHLFGWQLLLVGALPDRFPHPSLNALDVSAVSDLIYPAFTLAGLIMINQLLAVVVTDQLSEARGEVKFNRELMAQGVANMACPFFGAPPGVAMLARTMASARAGAVSRWSVFAHSFVLFLFLLPLSNLISQIPLAVLGAVTFAVGLQLIGWKQFRALKEMNRLDATLFLLTFGLVILSDLIVGVGIGALVAMLLFIERAAQSTRLEAVDPDGHDQGSVIDSLGTSTLHSGMQMYRVTGPLFFASSEKVFTQLTREMRAKNLILDLTDAKPIDSAATDCLRRLAQRQRHCGGELHLIGLDRELFSRFEKDGLFTEFGLVIKQGDHRGQFSVFSSPCSALNRLKDDGCWMLDAKSKQATLGHAPVQ
jgi:SulP family sulfate permease